MEKPPITTVQINNFDIWYESEDPKFTDISLKSNLPEHWVSYQPILSGPNKNSVIKPINSYVQRLVPPPKLLSIENNIVTLRQENHAEIFLLVDKDGDFYNVDRPWMRQYYQTVIDIDKNESDDCFEGDYKFYVPWFIDHDVEVSIKRPDADTPFIIYPDVIKYTHIPSSTQYVEPAFVPFHFKKVGRHMINDKFGKIPRQSPMFDMVFSANDIMIDRIRKFYEEKESADN